MQHGSTAWYRSTLKADSQWWDCDDESTRAPSRILLKGTFNQIDILSVFILCVQFLDPFSVSLYLFGKSLGDSKLITISTFLENNNISFTIFEFLFYFSLSRSLALQRARTHTSPANEARHHGNVISIALWYLRIKIKITS